MTEERPRRREGRTGVLVLVLSIVPLALQASMVRAFGVNMLIWDEFYYVPFVHLVRTGGDWSKWIFLQHNEHRMVPMKLVLAPLSVWTSWSVVAEMYVSVALVALTMWGLWRIFRPTSDRGALAFLPLAFLLCNPAQYFNMLTGIQMAFYFTLLGMIWAFSFLQRGTLPGTVAAAASATLASFSTATGFLVWPVGLLQLILARARKATVLVWSAAGLCCILLYFWNYQSPGQISSRPIFVGIGATIRFFLATVGAPLAGGSRSASTIIGGVVILLGLAWVIRDLRHGDLRNPVRAPLYALLASGIIAAALVTIGRASFGLTQALESRYVTFTELAVVGLYALAIGRTVPKPVTALFCSLLVAGLGVSSAHGIREARLWRSNQEALKTILLDYDRQPASALELLYFPNDLAHYAPYLEHERLVAFHDRPPRSLLTDRGFVLAWGDARFPRRVAAGERTTGQVEVVNLSSETWPGLREAGGPAYAVRLGCRVLDPAGAEVMPLAERGELPGAVPAGARASISYRFEAPRRPGAYRLECDLVQELNSWFSAHGNPKMTVDFIVG